jgi:hypothetical protein
MIYIKHQYPSSCDGQAVTDHLLRVSGVTAWPCELSRDVRGAEVHLRRVVDHEWVVAPALILREHVDLRVEALDRLHRAHRDDRLATADLLALDATQERAHVVTCLGAVELLVEHLDTSEGRLDLGAEANNLNVRALRGDTTLALRDVSNDV